MSGKARPAERYVGLISGTSMDGIDAVVVDFASEQPILLAALAHPFDDDLRTSLDALRHDPDRFPVARLGALDAGLGDHFAKAALAAIDAAELKPADVCAVGSHGQTVVHHAEADPPFTLQIGDPHRIAAQTGITTVADFRRSDLAAGGQGAPLAPLLHKALFRADDESRAVVNLGGIANVTLLEPGRPVRGFDTGPANCFLDLWFHRHHGQARFDLGGAWASSGRVDAAWLDKLLAEPYFLALPPKSTGIEHFSPSWLERRLPDWASARAADVQATLAELSAITIAEDMRQAVDGALDRVLLCGGGVHNADLVNRLQARLGGTIVESTQPHGLDPDFVEATLFAWLAQQRLAGQLIDTRSITGAEERIFAGTLFEPGGE